MFLGIGLRLGMQGGGSFPPAALFASGEEGAWFDPSDLSTLFQDSAGTTPVTTAGQPVGLMLDKSGRDNHATQATSAKRPTYQTAGGLHWLATDGVDDHMKAAYGVTLTNLVRAIGYRASLLDFIADDDTETNRSSLFAIQDGNLRWGVSGSGAGNAVVGVGGWVAGAELVAVASAYSDGALALSGTGSPASGIASIPLSNSTGITIGGPSSVSSNLLSGRIYGIVDLGRVITDDEKSNLSQYMAARTGGAL